MYKWL